jgi:hypothetical protein
MQANSSSIIVSEATPAEAAALSRLGRLSSSDIVRLCERWLEDDLDRGSADVAWIASESSPVMSDLASPFARALRDLAGDPPSVQEAARTVVHLYARAIADGRVPAEQGMDALNDIANAFSDWPVRLIHNPDRDPADTTKYAGEKLGLEHLYTWYRELQDAKDGSDLFYFNDLPRDQRLAKFDEELRAAALRLATHLEGGG